MEELIKNIASLPAEQKTQLFKLIKEQGINVLDLPIVKDAEPSGPLSYAQERLLFLHQMFHGDPSDNVPVAFRLKGELNIDLLEKSFSTIISRHAILRTNFIKNGNQTHQKILDAVPFNIQVVELAAEAGEEKLQKLVSEESRKTFDLFQLPLIRVTVFKVADQDAVLLINMHHAVSDGWSMNIVYNELSEIYKSLVKNQSATLAELDISYLDFAKWQRNFINEEMLETQIDYWTSQLVDSPPVLEVPKDYARPSTLSFKGKKHRLSISKDKYEGLLALAKEKGGTLFMTLTAAFQVLLYRYTASEDIVIATPVANRFKPEIEHLIGIFLNMLVLRGDLSGNPTFNQYLDRVKGTTLQAFANQNVPFEKLVEKLSPTRDMSYHPIFQVLLQVSPKHKLSLENLKVDLFEFDSETAQYDLALHLFEDSDGLSGYFEYNVGLFSEITIERLSTHLQRLIDSILQNPDTPIEDLGIITEQEIALVEQWNGTDKPYPSQNTLVSMFEEQVKATPQASALEFEGQKLTYRQLDEKANQLAHHLLKLGLNREEPVGILLDRSMEMVISIYAILKAGGAYLPIDPDYPQDRISFMMDDANLKLLISSQDHNPLISKTDINAVLVDDWDQLPTDLTKPLVEITESDLAYIIYTSGSTGKPKGVMIEHGSICNRLIWMQEEYQLVAEDVVLQKTPFSFDVSVWEFFWPLLFGAKLTIAKPEGHKDSAYLVDLIKSQSVSTLHFVPSMLKIFLEEEGVGTCSSLKRVICSGEALEYETQEHFYEKLDCGLYNLYGPTEAAVDVTSWSCQKDAGDRRVPIGKPIANTTTYILDPKGNLAPLGVPGELHLGGVQLARGYLNRPELTKERFIKNPFSDDPESRLYKTGDLVRYLPDGNIDYLGRNDFQVKIRGFRIELGEIEQQLISMESIDQAVVLARNDLPGGTQLVAYVIAEPAHFNESETRMELKQNLPDYMVPAYMVKLDQFPLSVNGKLNRLALPKPDISKLGSEKGAQEPKGDLETKIAEIWQELLDLDRVGLDDNFFEVGGHSILMAQVQKKIKEELSGSPSIIELFRYPTIRSLAKFLRQDEQQASKHDAVKERVKKQKQNIFQKRRFAK